MIARLRALGSRVARVARHEWTIASVVSALIAIAMTWPTLRHPTQTIPQDIWDPLLQTWQIGWSSHALTSDAKLWDSNTFYPLPLSFAFSDTLLGYAPLGLLGAGPVAALVHYNILFVFAFALASLGAYALARQLGAGWPGAAVAGAAFAYAPWRYSQAGHLHVLSSGGIVLALAMLARGHGWSLRDGWRRDRLRPGWTIAGWLVATWQITLGFGIGIPFAYVMAGCVVAGAIGWWRSGRPALPRTVLAAQAGGMLFFVGVSAAMARPYLEVLRQHPYARRTYGELDWYSPPLWGYFIAPQESRTWGATLAPLREHLATPNEMAVLAGFVLYGLAIVGLFYSVWSRLQRWVLGLSTLAVALCASGTSLADGAFGYFQLYHLPGWDGIRTPGRLVLYFTLLLGILAAGAVTAVVRDVREVLAERAGAPRWQKRASLGLAMVIPVALVLVEGLNLTPHPTVPTQPAALRNLDGPALILPSLQLTDMPIMYWSTDGFPKIGNGNSGFGPRLQGEIRRRSQSFPDAASVDYLGSLGFRTVVVIPGWAVNTEWAGAATRSTEGLPLTRKVIDGVVVYTITNAKPPHKVTPVN